MSVNETNETNETGVGGARADMLAHMGSLQQAVYTRPIEYQEGRAHGLKAGPSTSASSSTAAKTSPSCPSRA